MKADPARLDAAVRYWTDKDERRWISTYAASPWGEFNTERTFFNYIDRIKWAYHALLPKTVA